MSAKEDDTEYVATALVLSSYSELDFPSNPYPDFVQTDITSTFLKEDVAGVESTHVYCMPGVPDSRYITSASCVFDVWRTFKNPKNDGMSFEEAIRVVKNGGRFSPSLFEATVPLLSNTLVEYVNFMLLNPQIHSDMNYNKRAHTLMGIQVSKLGQVKPKNFTGFLPGNFYKKLEEWILGPQNEQFEVGEELQAELELFSRMIGFNIHLVNSEKLRESLGFHFEKSGRSPITSREICDLYRMPSQWGTNLHLYLERRLKGMTHEEAIEGVYIREPEDIQQAEAFLSSLGKRAQVVEVEKAYSSQRARLCGKIDLIIQLPNGRKRISDHKRSNDLAMFCGVPSGQSNVIRVKLSDHCFSSAIVGNALQQAVYDKLQRLNGETNLDTVIELNVFHPSLAQCFVIEVDLIQPLKKDSRDYFAGLAKGEALSPIELVERLFDKLAETLKAEITIN